MKIYWAGTSEPPQGVYFTRVADLDHFHEHALVFIDDPGLIHDDLDPLARVYLVTDGETPASLPEEIVGVLPRDVQVIKAIADLYGEIRDMFTIGDRLIASLSEKNRDIQEKQATLQRESKKHMAIVKHASDIIFLLGRSGKITFCNDTMHTYLAPHDALVGKAFVDFVIDEDRDGLGAMLEAGFQKNSPARMDVRLSLATGKTGIFSLMSTPLQENDATYALSCIGRDVTEIHAMQNRLAVQANDFECMTKGLAHELRNPLTVIGAYLKKMGTEERRREFKQKFQTMLASLDRIEHMVGRIERYESIANYGCSFTHVDIGRLIRETVKAEAPSLPVTIKVRDKTPVYTDPYYLKIALSRILENAGENGSPSIEIHACGEGGYAYIAVRDFGPGIQDDPADIFAPFFSTDPMKVGLGLTEARIAMVKIGGEIELIPRADPGAVFVLKLHRDRRQTPRKDRGE